MKCHVWISDQPGIAYQIIGSEDGAPVLRVDVHEGKHDKDLAEFIAELIESRL